MARARDLGIDGPELQRWAADYALYVLAHGSGYHRSTVIGGPLITLFGVIALALAALAVTLIYMSKRGVAALPNVAPADDQVTSAAPRPGAFRSEAVAAAIDEQYKLMFAVARCDYRILGEHAQVLHSIHAAAQSSVHEREYFPRRPMLLPKLLQALNDSESTRQELVRLILSDPVLAGSVLERANSAFYRLSLQRVESLDRAVVLLGSDGLRRLLATAILQPVFRLPEGYFERFAPYTWEQAQRAAAAAEAYAGSNTHADPFVAQLLAVLMPLSRIVLFRLTLDKYREAPNILPRSEVFISAMQTHTAIVARGIAEKWELSESAIGALEAQVRRLEPASMTPLGQAVYFAELASTLALLVKHRGFATEAAQDILVAQGLESALADRVWHAALSAV